MGCIIFMLVFFLIMGNLHLFGLKCAKANLQRSHRPSKWRGFRKSKREPSVMFPSDILVQEQVRYHSQVEDVGGNVDDNIGEENKGKVCRNEVYLSHDEMKVG